MLHTASQTGVATNYPLSSKRESLYLDRETQLEAQLPSSGISIYGQDPTLSGIRSSGLGRAGAPIVTQVVGYNCLKYFSLMFHACGREVDSASHVHALAHLMACDSNEANCFL